MPSGSFLISITAVFMVCLGASGSESNQSLSPLGDFWVSEDYSPESGEMVTTIHSARNDLSVPLQGLPSTTMRHEFAISPDEDWLKVTGKLYHGLAGGWLFRRQSDDNLRFNLLPGIPFYALAWNYFETVTGIPAGGTDRKQGIIDFVAWRPGKLRVSLRGYLDTVGVTDWIAEYDLGSGTFSIPEDANAHNHSSVQPLELFKRGLEVRPGQQPLPHD